jgi:hypothetical protein
MLYELNMDSENFKKNTVLKYITCSDSGKCYLMTDLNNNFNREWIMYYQLEKMVE